MKTSQAMHVIRGFISNLSSAENFLLGISVFAFLIYGILLFVSVFRDASWVIKYSKSNATGSMDEWISNSKTQRQHASDYMVKELSKFSFLIGCFTLFVFIFWIVIKG